MSHQQYSNENRGALFVNDRKQTEKHPDMQGKINVNGVDYYLSGWWKKTTKGEILSLSLGQQVEQRQEEAPQAARGRGRPQPVSRQPGENDGFEDSSIPF